MCGLLVAGKLIFQAIVRMKTQWDEINQDGELAAKWQEWLTELEKCNRFCVSRSILPKNGNIKDMNLSCLDVVMEALSHMDELFICDGTIMMSKMSS